MSSTCFRRSTYKVTDTVRMAELVERSEGRRVTYEQVVAARRAKLLALADLPVRRHSGAANPQGFEG